MIKSQARLSRDGETHEEQEHNLIGSKVAPLPPHHRKACQGSKGAIGSAWRSGKWS
ncbi:hypothetical protein [Cyanobium gracile]|uniref:hypothetical protein n=1 Tax=Cyanobium gracile TaxID=59930 RepID=UPI0012EAFBBE|nr:hypothetical protein [Cyanobium gracile]